MGEGGPADLLVVTHRFGGDVGEAGEGETGVLALEAFDEPACVGVGYGLGFETGGDAEVVEVVTEGIDAVNVVGAFVKADEDGHTEFDGGGGEGGALDAGFECFVDSSSPDVAEESPDNDKRRVRLGLTTGDDTDDDEWEGVNQVLAVAIHAALRAR